MPTAIDNAHQEDMGDCCGLASCPLIPCDCGAPWPHNRAECIGPFAWAWKLWRGVEWSGGTARCPQRPHPHGVYCAACGYG